MMNQGETSMRLEDWLGVLSGLSLFIYGMTLMSESLEQLAAIRLKKILETLTNHKVKAIVVGIVVTCLLQSSSAMTIMLIGFVNAKILKLENAIWVMMGANIGTTITGQIVAFDIGMFAPVLAIIGIILSLFLKKLCSIGYVCIGSGFLFIGLDMLSISFLPLQDSSLFLTCLQILDNPIYAVLFGMIFTAIIQSSSASIAILQSLCSQNLIPFSQAVYFIFGFDIGTCITAFLASLTGCLNAKKLAMFHLLMNIFGMVVFVFLCQLTSLTHWIASLSVGEPMRQIANMHTFFNVVTTILILFFDKYLIHIINKIIHVK